MIINEMIHIKLNMVNSMLEDTNYFRKFSAGNFSVISSALAVAMKVFRFTRVRLILSFKDFTSGRTLSISVDISLT